MTDILQRAQLLHDSLSPAPWSVKPIKLGDIAGEPCLHDAIDEMTGLSLDDLAAMRNMLPDLIAEVKRWQQIAKEERAKYNAAIHCVTMMVHPKAIVPTMKTIDDHVFAFREQAAKELEIENRKMVEMTPERRDALEWISEWMSDDANDRRDPEQDHSYKVLREMLEETK